MLSNRSTKSLCWPSAAPEKVQLGQFEVFRFLLVYSWLAFKFVCDLYTLFFSVSVYDIQTISIRTLVR